MAEQQVKDLYKILDVEKDATDKDIQKAYRRLSKKWHPDVSEEPDAAEVFQKIIEAYEVLSDPEKRKEYDEFAKSVQEGNNLKDFNEVFKEFHSGIKGVYAPIRGEDIAIEVPFAIKDVKQGLEKTVEFDRFVNCKSCEGHGLSRKAADPCTSCSGRGYTLDTVESVFGEMKTRNTCTTCSGKGFTNTQDCEPCKGKGKMNDMINLKVKLPEYSRDGMKIVLTGRGDEGLNGGFNGDLHLVLKHDEKDGYWITNTYDINTILQVPIDVALEGGAVPFELPSGKTIQVPITKGARNGDLISEPEAGLLNRRNGYYGLLTFTVERVLPDIPEAKLKRMIELLRS